VVVSDSELQLGIGHVDALADGMRELEVEGRVLHRSEFAGGDQVFIHRSVALGVNLQLVLKRVAAAFTPYEIWFTGLRREQSKSRANLQAVDTFTLPSGKQLRKVSPLGDWMTREVWQYATEHQIPLLPLYDLGYSSVGCQPCTSLPTSADDPRSGRWSGRKLECGIHIQPS
jgi:phosphoadenylyl-sulfate reductase (thioredoxin)